MKTLSSLIEEQIFSSFTSFNPGIGKSIYVSGLEGASLSALAATKFHELEKDCRSMLIVMRNAKSAEILTEDLESWLGNGHVFYFPGLDLRPYEWRNPFGFFPQTSLCIY